MTSDPVPRVRAEITDDTIRLGNGSLRMDAYHYGFDPTGCEPVDKILAAVALAGKMLHHTEDWGQDLWYGDPGPVEIIEHFACQAAAALDARAAEIERLRAENADAYELAYDDGRLDSMEAASPADIGMVPVRRDETSGYMLWREATP